MSHGKVFFFLTCQQYQEGKCCFGAGVGGGNLLLQFDSSSLASAILGDVVKVI